MRVGEDGCAESLVGGRMAGWNGVWSFADIPLGEGLPRYVRPICRVVPITD